MSEIFGCLSDELGGADEALALASYAAGTGSGSGWANYSGSGGVGKNAGNPLLKRSRLYYQNCYLNSLLQSLYLTPEFRQLLFDLSDSELGLSAYHAHELAEAEAKAALEAMSDDQRAAHKAALALQAVEINEESVAEFTAMGVERVNAVRALRKFPKPAQKEEAMEYVFSHDFSLDPPEPADSAASSKPKKREYKRIPIEFRRFFAQLQLGSQGVIGTEGITKSFGWDAKEGQASVQHDIQELYIRLMEALSGSLAGSSGEGRMESLYRGTMVTRTTCSVCGNVSARREHCYNFHAHVKGMKNLRQSLEAAVTPEKLEGSNAYFCHSDVCKRKVTAWRQDSIATLPPLLSIALNRHEYNKKNWQRVKINDRLPFPLVIDMQPYHEAQVAKTREQLEAEDARSKAAAKSGAASSASAAAPAQPQTDLEIAIANSLKDPSAADGEQKSGAPKAEDSAAEKKEAESNQQGGGKNKNKGGKNQQGGGSGGGGGARKGNKNAPSDADPDEPLTGLEASVFDASSPHLYDLFSIVVHSGGAHGGHYFAYVKDVVAQENYWQAHPEAREQYEQFCRDPAGASSAAAPGQKAAGYSGDQSKSRHPSFWSELNDSSVSSIGFDKLASQYGGRRTCAYILMYRHRGLQGSDIVRGTGPIVPAALQERVARFNSQLDEERLIYDTLSNEIEIELHAESEFSVHAGQLYPAGYDPTKVEQDEKADEERRALLQMEDAANGNGMEGFDFATGAAEKDATSASDAAAASSVSAAASVAVAPVAASSMEAVNAPPRRFIVDQRITVPELHARVSAFLAAEAAAAAKAGSAPPLIPEKLVLNQLSIKMRPPHQVEGYLSLDDPLEANPNAAAASASSVPAAAPTGGRKKKKPNPKTLEQLGFSSVQQLLVWNGATINSAPFHTGTKKDQVINLHAVLFGADVIEKVQARAAIAAAKALADGVDAPESLVAAATNGGDRLEFYLTVSPATNLTQLGSLLLSRLGLDEEQDDFVDNLFLVSMHPHSKAIKVLPVGSEDEQSKPIKILGVVNHSWMGVEFRVPSSKVVDSSSKKKDDDPVAARMYFGELQQCVRLVVVNELPASLGLGAPVAAGEKPPAVLSKFETEALKSSTVGALKAVALEKLRAAGHPELKASQFRLRKVAGLDKAGALLMSETATLAQADLAEDDMRVRAEEGGLPDPATQLDMLVTLLANVSVGAAGSSTDALSSETAPPKQALAKLVDRAPFLAERSWTIKQTKAAMLARFGLGHRNETAFCLYRGYATYDEHAKPFTSEFMTLGAMQLGQSEWMWLEEGEVPTSGMIQIDVVMCIPQANQNEVSSVWNAAADKKAAAVASSDAAAASSSSSCAAAESFAASAAASAVSSSSRSPVDDPTLSLQDWRAMQQPLSPYTPAQPLTAPVTIAPVPQEGDAGSSSASSASSSSAAESTAVVPAAAKDVAGVSYVFVTPRPSYLMSSLFSLKFSCNDSLLEFKQVLHAYPDSPLGSALSPSHLRVRQATRADGLGKWLNADEKSLKKQGISSDKRLLVQMLPPDPPEINMSAGALLLRLCTAVPHRDSGVVVGPAALQEFVFDDGEYPQLSALQASLSAFAGIADASSIAVLKWVGVGLANKETLEKEAAAEAAKEKNAANKGKTDDAAAAMPAAVPAAAASPSSVPKGWIVLFPNGPDPADSASASAPGASSAADGKKGQQQQPNGGKKQGGGQQQQGQGKKGQQNANQQGGKGGKGGQQNQGGGKGGKGGSNAQAAPKAAVPAWSLKFGSNALHEDDVLCCVRFEDFGLRSGDLADLSSLVRSWDLRVAPPGYTLVEKDRAEELEKIAERERAKKAAPKHKEIELRIEY